VTGWNPIASDITESSVWHLPDPIRLAWVAIIAKKDHRTHLIKMNAWKLAQWSRITEAQAIESIRIFESPDPNSTSQAEEGRRIMEVEPGVYWVVTGGEYAVQAGDDKEKESAAIRAKRYRDNKKLKAIASGDKPATSQNSEPTMSPFDMFWRVYPLKKGKEDTQKALAKALKKTTIEVILAAVVEQMGWEEWTKDGGQYRPHPATWLNRGGWADEKAGKPPADESRFFTAPGNRETDDAVFAQVRKDVE
jgi:hypothetical protein